MVMIAERVKGPRCSALLLEMRSCERRLETVVPRSEAPFSSPFNFALNPEIHLRLLIFTTWGPMFTDVTRQNLHPSARQALRARLQSGIPEQRSHRNHRLTGAHSPFFRVSQHPVSLSPTPRFQPRCSNSIHCIRACATCHGIACRRNRLTFTETLVKVCDPLCRRTVLHCAWSADRQRTAPRVRCSQKHGSKADIVLLIRQFPTLRQH